jgi:hypothetical protein
LKIRFRVRKPHEPDSGEVLSVKQGARLEFERRPTEWEGWIWCTSPGGPSAWVPESWVTVEGRSCVMLKDYVSRELALEAGVEVTGEFVESGWAWVRSSGGDEGWVPLECLERMGE